VEEIAVGILHPEILDESKHPVAIGIVDEVAPTVVNGISPSLNGVACEH